MQSLFSKVRFSKGSFSSPALDMALSRQKASIEKIKKYYAFNYKNDGIDKTSSGLIFKLFEFLNSSTPLIATANNLDKICSPLGIVTGDLKGKVINDFFSEKGTIYISNTYYSTPELLTTNDYKSLSPMRFLSRDNINESLTKPNAYEDKGDYAVIGVDIIAYMRLVFLWNKAQEKKPLEERETIYELVNRYVYPNMLDSAMDCIMTNIYGMSDLDSISGQLTSFPTVLGVRDYTDNVMEEALKLKDQYLNKSQDFNMTLAGLPAYTSTLDNVQPKVFLPETSQSFWAITSGYVNYTNMAMTIASKSDPELKSIQNTLKRIDRRVRSTRVFGNISDKEVREVIQSRYDNIFLEADIY